MLVRKARDALVFADRLGQAFGNIVVVPPPHGLVILDARTGRVRKNKCDNENAVVCPVNTTTAACGRPTVSLSGVCSGFRRL